MFHFLNQVVLFLPIIVSLFFLWKINLFLCLTSVSGGGLLTIKSQLNPPVALLQAVSASLGVLTLECLFFVCLWLHVLVSVLLAVVLVC